HVAAAACRVVDGGELDAGDVGQVGRQEAALERARHLVAVLVEAGGVDRRRRPAGELGGERRVVRPVGAPRLGGDERERAVGAPAGGQRRDDRRADVEAAQDGAVLLIGARLPERGRHPLYGRRLTGVQAARSGGRLRVGGVAA